MVQNAPSCTLTRATPCELKSHSDDPVPLLISGDKIKPNDVFKFCERDCRIGNLDSGYRY